MLSWFLLPISWKSVLSSSVGLLDPENIGLAVEMRYCLVYKLINKYFHFSDCYLGFSTSGLVENHLK